MKTAVRALYELIRIHVRSAAMEEAKVAPFNLSGRGHEARVTLNRRLAGVLRGQNIPCVYISGYGANNHYPLRVFLRAEKSLNRILRKSPLAIYSGTAVLNEPVEVQNGR